MPNHEALKEWARRILKDMGFTEDQIIEEYPVPKGSQIGNLTMKEGFIVDVVGIKAGSSIAVECGLTNSDKVHWLKLFFDEVLILPYFKTENDVAMLERRVRELTDELTKTKREFEDFKTGAIAEYDLNMEAVRGWLIKVLEPLVLTEDGHNRYPFNATAERIARAYWELAR